MELNPYLPSRADASPWRFWGLIGFSLVLHSLLTPWGALIGLLGLLSPMNDEIPNLPPITAIPIDLFEAPELKKPHAAEPLPVEPEPTPAIINQEQAQTLAPEVKEAPKPPAEALAASEEQPDTEDGAIGDPVVMSGKAGNLADANANVRLLVDTEKIRTHPLGVRVGEVLKHVPQWRDFFGPAGLDPVKDVDRILVAGPQLRDSSEVVAVIKYNVPDERVIQAVDNLVKRSGGEWLQGRLKAARAKADRADRTFVFVAPGVVAVVPPSAEKNTLALDVKELPFPTLPGDKVATVFVNTPHRVFIGLPLNFNFPKSIQSVRLDVAPRAEGGLVTYVQAIDEDEKSAKKNADALETAISTLATPRGSMAVALLLFSDSKSLIESLTLSSEKDRIVGKATLSGNQLDLMLKFAYNRFVPAQAGPSRAAPDPTLSLAPTPLPGQKSVPDAGPLEPRPLGSATERD